MDFSKLTANKKKNSVITSIRTATQVEDKPVETRKLTGKETESWTYYKKVYQGCDKCGTERVHNIKGDHVVCMYCLNTYLLQAGKKPFTVQALTMPQIQRFIWL
jgi:hypothetical protein